eukprot:5235661-Prymnesium_polylepis.1
MPPLTGPSWCERLRKYEAAAARRREAEAHADQSRPRWCKVAVVRIPAEVTGRASARRPRFESQRRCTGVRLGNVVVRVRHGRDGELRRRRQLARRRLARRLAHLPRQRRANLVSRRELRRQRARVPTHTAHLPRHEARLPPVCGQWRAADGDDEREEGVVGAVEGEVDAERRARVDDPLGCHRLVSQPELAP